MEDLGAILARLGELVIIEQDTRATLENIEAERADLIRRVNIARKQPIPQPKEK